MGSRTVRFSMSFYDTVHGLFAKDTVYKNIPDEITLPKSGCEIIEEADIDPEYDNVRTKQWLEDPASRPVGVTRQKRKAAAKKAPARKVS